MRLRASAADPELRSALEALYQRERRFIELDPGATRATLEALGNPQRSFPAVQVGGTNGKGSVCAMVAAAVAGEGRRVGLFTSPHLVDWRERMQVNAAMPSEAVALELIREAVAGAERARVSLTFFEVTTVAAVLYFARAAVDLAVFEVGLGGRLDATCAVEPRCTSVVSIGVDHVRLLGDDPVSIAAEKAGIARAGVPLVCGRVGPEPLAEIRRVCLKRGAPLFVLGEDYSFSSRAPRIVDYAGPRWRLAGVAVPLPGAHQLHNAAVALRIVEAITEEVPGAVPGREAAVLRTGPEAVRTGLGRAVWPGRYEVLGRPDGGRLVLDVAHNADGARVLARAVREEGDAPAHLVYGGMRDKDHGAMLDALAPHVSSLTFTRSEHGRSAEPAALWALAQERWPHLPAIVGEEPAAQVALAVAGRAAPGESVLVAGSIYLMGEVRDALRAWCDGGDAAIVTTT